MTDKENRFPDWKKLYQDQPVESMPWYKPDLDEDLLAELHKRKITSGEFLDIGTGPATQAVQLTHRGFHVTATDLSPAAIKRAQDLFKKENIRFIEDDILVTKVSGSFDYALDRGCFHVLPPEKRQVYVQTLHSLLKPGGLIFLKCFSVNEAPRDFGPYRFTGDDIRKIFNGFFNVQSSQESIFTGVHDEGRKALFSVLKRL